MYDGNGGVYSSHTTSEGQHEGKATRGHSHAGGLRIKPLYIYFFATVAALIAAYFIVRFLNTDLVMHFGLAAGVVLLVANLREFIGRPYIYTQQSNYIALLNSLVGGALVFAWLSQIISVLLWVPAIGLWLAALPLMLGRSAAYTTYAQTASRLVGRVRGKTRVF